MNPAAANRLNALVDQYPLFSKSGEALYEAGDAYSKMGPRFRKQAGEMFARLVKEYPLSNRADDARKRLEDMEIPIPAVDAAALARAKFEQEKYRRPGLMARGMGWLKTSPDVSHAATSGAPTMTDPKATIPASVPIVASTETPATGASGAGTTDVSATQINSTNSALDKNPDARSSGGTARTASDAAPQQPLPTNRDKDLKKLREQQAKKQAKLDKKKKKTSDQPAAAAQNQQNQSSATQGAQTPTGTPNVVSAPPAGSQPPQQPVSSSTAPQ